MLLPFRHSDGARPVLAAVVGVLFIMSPRRFVQASPSTTGTRRLGSNREHDEHLALLCKLTLGAVKCITYEVRTLTFSTSDFKLQGVINVSFSSNLMLFFVRADLSIRPFFLGGGHARHSSCES